MINNFSLFSFKDNTWKDLSSNLPPHLQHIGGHEMVNIGNSKLAILGGYKTSNYSFDIGLSAIDPEFRDFKNLFIYDIKNNEWERKVTIISQQDSNILSLRQQYSCTAVYRNNVIYAYAGFYIDPTTRNLVHLFGILDFGNLVWKWKQVQINNPSYENANSTHFDSILLQNYMIVNQFNATNSGSAKLIPFDLNIEEIDTYIDYDPTDSSKPPNFKHYKTPPYYDEQFPLAAIIIPSIVASIAALIIIFLIYRYIKHTIKKKSTLNYETKEVWSDSNSFFRHLNSSAIFSHSKTNANYQGSIIEHFDTNMTMSASYLEQTVESNWEKNTLLTRQIFDSHTNSFQTSGTLVHQRGKPYNGNTKSTEFSDNWDAYSTY
ncbi:hypothetical protein CONCODRAFT_80742 [Conidiobolus coronatus NRRL 28638]|uniref:Galactose oxidase n=1 Tax=Conidiobolus coronatus (strain ATCC 28846 / CBS 209.66 / NRRL 28638) TaxID=796925 RepID=A0A137NS39_CONC2|nr:hypothetical protein CONCODRAFT_80742 [Conidiobolus coronatus NRRL 28638]|eukprot:KXN65544.1 hypothetical protein CONCODRAFT_80742 [Conidiobolus coronatus NRRL 28638]